MDPLDWCRKRLLVAGNPLTATLPFADPEQRGAILALRCVMSEIAAGAGGLDDPEPGLAKLDWWRQALRENNPHPAIAALSMSGVTERLKAVEFDPLIDGVAASLTNPRFESMVDAWRLFQSVGGQAGVLEARLLEVDSAEAEVFRDIGTGGYLVRVVRDLAIDARANRWLVPLELQADFQVSRQDVIGTTAGTAFDGMVRAMLGHALKQGQSAVDELAPDQAWRHRHLLIQWSLDCRLAGMLARRPRRILQRRVLPGHAGNVWCAWRRARQLGRRFRNAPRSRR
jgi:15-cis-phytoene synthase